MGHAFLSGQTKKERERERERERQGVGHFIKTQRCRMKIRKGKIMGKTSS
jgi:hypothetical protein